MYSEEVLHACLAIAHDCLLSRGFLVSPSSVPAFRFFFFFFFCPPTQLGSNWKGTSRGTPLVLDIKTSNINAQMFHA